MLKVRSDAKFLYEHSKTVSGNAEVTASFSQKRRSYLGGRYPDPSAYSIQRGCALHSYIISLHNSMRTKFWGVPVFRGERFKYFS